MQVELPLAGRNGVSVYVNPAHVTRVVAREEYPFWCYVHTTDGGKHYIALSQQETARRLNGD